MVPFKNDHLTKYGLLVQQCHPVSAAVILVKFQFFVEFFGEDNVGSKKNVMVNVKDFWTFTTMWYLQQLNFQYPKKLSGYSDLTKDRKNFFQSGDGHFVNTILTRFDSSDTLRISINNSIVEVLVRYMLLSYEDL